MIQFNFPNNRQLKIESDGSRFRIIVLENGEEWVCRRENLRNLTDFIAAGEAHIFKGRLQLSKHDGKISVAVKGEQVGVIDARKLSEMLKALKSQPAT